MPTPTAPHAHITSTTRHPCPGAREQGGRRLCGLRLTFLKLLSLALVRCGKVRFHVKPQSVRYLPSHALCWCRAPARRHTALALCQLAAPQRTEMLVLLRASADRASPTTRLRPRPVPVMATEEPVLRPQLMGAAALTGTATGVAVSGFKVATLGAAAALYSGPLALPELPGSELGPYVLVHL